MGAHRNRRTWKKLSEGSTLRTVAGTSSCDPRDSKCPVSARQEQLLWVAFTRTGSSSGRTHVLLVAPRCATRRAKRFTRLLTTSTVAVLGQLPIHNKSQIWLQVNLSCIGWRQGASLVSKLLWQCCSSSCLGFRGRCQLPWFSEGSI